MHLRPAFIEIDPARIRTLIEAHSFGLLVTAADGMDASHIPFTVHDTGADDAGEGVIGVEGVVAGEAEVLVGPVEV